MAFKIFIQAVGIVAMAINTLSYQCPTKKGILRMQLVSSLLFMFHFGMIGAITGSILNGIGAFRAVVYGNRDKKWTQSKIWLPLFITLYLTAYVMTFTVFGKEATLGNLALELLPVMGMIVTNIAFLQTKERRLRMLALINSPLWMAYNGINGSIGGTVTEIISLISIIIAVIRFDILKGGKKAADDGEEKQ
ncbi:MAG: YgjV family protein [Clostridia bacterium]|nr:YgjV family protein [Clostridia bacterium]